MRAVGIKVLKNRLSEYVRLAAGGETILVLDRERVVAELQPPASARVQRPPEDWRQRGVAEGWLRPALLPPAPPAKRFPRMTLEQLMAELDESRADRDLP